MTIELALKYIPGRMEELGYGTAYNIRFRHFVLLPNEKKTIHAGNQLFILIEPGETVNVESDFGIYDLSIDNTNELQYEHQGNICIRNHASITKHARFIQVIPKNENQCQ
jgi:hypothetical protein